MKIHAHSFTFFQFPTSTDLTDITNAIDIGEDYLNEFRLSPVGPLEMAAQGLVEVTKGDLVRYLRVGDEHGYWMAVGTTTKILPPSSVNEALVARLKEIEELEGRKPGGRERKRIKDDLIAEMLPRAFTRTVHTHVLLFPDIGLAAAAVASKKRAEAVVSEIRSILGRFPALPVNAEVAPRSVLTGWLAGEELPDGFVLGDMVSLEDPAFGGPKVKIQNDELPNEETTSHLEAGKQVTEIALHNGDRSSFKLDEHAVIRRLRIGEAVMDELEEFPTEDEGAYQVATMTIVAAELLILFGTISSAFCLTPAGE